MFFNRQPYPSRVHNRDQHQEDFMKHSDTRQQKDDRGGRRQLKDRRFQVPAAPDEENRTNWKRRSGLDQRTGNHETDKEKTETP
ncbi:MAG: hypothetical protein C4522_22500 [Desulfobacteraceae bacterium]|nr:MAG: hypothetical protein C4522_22500 [Desulfobacteraceae bacterium]